MAVEDVSIVDVKLAFFQCSGLSNRSFEWAIMLVYDNNQINVHLVLFCCVLPSQESR